MAAHSPGRGTPRSDEIRNTRRALGAVVSVSDSLSYAGVALVILKQFLHPRTLASAAHVHVTTKVAARSTPIPCHLATTSAMAVPLQVVCGCHSHS